MSLSLHCPRCPRNLYKYFNRSNTIEIEIRQGGGTKALGAEVLRSLETFIPDQTNYPCQGLRLPIINRNGASALKVLLQGNK
jgi:hypothetical protein